MEELSRQTVSALPVAGQRGRYSLTLEQMKFVWDHYVPHEIDRLRPLAAPLRADLRGLPSVLLVLPEMDILRSEGDAMAKKASCCWSSGPN